MVEDNGLAAEELIPAGGSWNGLLFDNPTIGLAPGLTWTFTFDFEDVARSYGTTGVSLTLDWVPLAAESWRLMAGQAASGSTFGEPIESSAYFFDHHRYDAAELRVVEQRGDEVRVVASVRGDLDRLGIEALDVDRWLRFEGIIVQLSDVPTSAAAATRRLAEFTDTTGLACTPTSRGFRFEALALA